MQDDREDRHRRVIQDLRQQARGSHAIAREGPQAIMLALSMVVIAAMIGADGLGNTVLTGIQRPNVGLGFKGGLGVVILAILLDRITQSFAPRRRR
jgi:ABC-type proline/glycine betaine transport system permease subunit